MGEPRRFEISNGDQFGYRVSIPNLLPNHDDRLAVREDRATEADLQAVALRLAERDHGGPLDGPVCTGYKDEAGSLLALIFGGEQSGV